MTSSSDDGGADSGHSAERRWRHDVKNQLGIVIGFAELLLDEPELAPRMRGDLEEILKAGQRAMELIESPADRV